MVERKYVDVNIFIYWLGGHPGYGEKAREWIWKIEYGNRGEYIISFLTLYELIVILSGLTGRNLRDGEFIKMVIEAISSISSLEIVPLEIIDHVNAYTLMDKYELGYEDSLHLATALRNKAVEIISNDKDFDKTPLKRIF